MAEPPSLVAAVRARSVAGLTRALDAQGGKVPPRVVIETAQAAWQEGLALIRRYGADLNVSYRNYRPIHALIQEKPHRGTAASPERLACLEWLLTHGANPELMGAWPAARALVIAAFSGEAAYVDVLREGGAKVDIFTAAALGDAKGVGRRLAKDRGLVRLRDGGLLTALQCCAGSRLGRTDAATAAGLLETARVLIETGADLNAHVRSWGHDVDVAYFVVRSGQVEMLKLFLERGLDPTAAVPPAAWDGREDLVDLLLEHGAKIDRARDHTRPVLNELVRWGQFTQARMLLARSADPNLADDRGWTALHQAVSRGNLQMVQDLMHARADPTLADRTGQTPRDLARARRRHDLLQLLR